MSLLEQQMKDLQSKQRKVQYLKTMLDGMGKEGRDPTDTGTTEITQEIETFLKAKIDEIENGKIHVDLSEEETSARLSPEVVSFVNELYNRAQARGAVPQTKEVTFYDEDSEEPAQAPVNPMERRGPRPQNPPTQASRQQKRGQPDLLRFAQENRHMHGKRVIVNTKGQRVGGTVSGIASVGFLQVTTDTGHAVPVAIENISLE